MKRRATRSQLQFASVLKKDNRDSKSDVTTSQRSGLVIKNNLLLQMILHVFYNSKITRTIQANRQQYKANFPTSTSTTAIPIRHDRASILARSNQNEGDVVHPACRARLSPHAGGR